MFTFLECDEDVLLFGKDTFTVGRFKELIKQDYESKNKNFILTQSNNIPVGTASFQLLDTKWNSINKDCQILRIGSKGWQKGKIRFQVTYIYSRHITEVYLEFCPDEPIEPESPLDDLRQLPEYKNA